MNSRQQVEAWLATRAELTPVFRAARPLLVIKVIAMAAFTLPLASAFAYWLGLLTAKELYFSTFRRSSSLRCRAGRLAFYSGDCQ
jgi:hypothetical protein